MRARNGRAPRLRTTEPEQRAIWLGRLAGTTGLPWSTRRSDQRLTVHACVMACQPAGTRARLCRTPGRAGAPQGPAGRRGAARAHPAAPAALGRRRGGLQVTSRPPLGPHHGGCGPAALGSQGLLRLLARVGPAVSVQGAALSLAAGAKSWHGALVPTCCCRPADERPCSGGQCAVPFSCSVEDVLAQRRCTLSGEEVMPVTCMLRRACGRACAGDETRVPDPDAEQQHIGCGSEARVVETHTCLRGVTI
jgi:hypothetical protein